MLIVKVESDFSPLMEAKQDLWSEIRGLRIRVLSGNSLVAAVPFPLMSGFHREEIGRSLVFHSLWEPQQHSVVQLSHPRMIRRPGGNNTGKKPQILPVCEEVSSLFSPPKP